MEWPEEAIGRLLQDLKIQTANLFDEYDKAEDRIAFLHDKIQTQLKQAQPLPYMDRAYTGHLLPIAGGQPYQGEHAPSQEDSFLLNHY